MPPLHLLTNILFLCGDCGKNIKNGKAFTNYHHQELYKDIVDVVMNGSHKKIGKGVELFQDIGSNGFHITSCQFALHYACESEEKFRNFAKNLQKYGKGLFFGTCSDGKSIYSILSGKKIIGCIDCDSYFLIELSKLFI
jgi:hypothetical protein